jgi:hypothetical protein
MLRITFDEPTSVGMLVNVDLEWSQRTLYPAP